MNLLANLSRGLRYLFDPRVPWQRKIWLYLTLFYFLLPLDLLPDLFPGIGWLDDLIVLSAGLWWFSRELARYRGWAEDRRDGAGQTIDVDYQVWPDEDPAGRDSSPKLWHKRPRKAR